MCSHCERTRAFNVEVRDNNGKLLHSGNIRATTNFHAVELAYTQAMHKWPDRSMYKAVALRVMLN